MLPLLCVPAQRPSTRSVMLRVPAIPLRSKELEGLATLACSLRERWACAPLPLVEALTKSTSRRNSERTFKLMPRRKTRPQHCKSSEAPTLSLRPRQAGPQSVACCPVLKFAANWWLSEFQVMPSQSAVYRSFSADAQLLAV